MVRLSYHLFPIAKDIRWCHQRLLSTVIPNQHLPHHTCYIPCFCFFLNRKMAIPSNEPFGRCFCVFQSKDLTVGLDENERWGFSRSLLALCGGNWMFLQERTLPQMRMRGGNARFRCSGQTQCAQCRGYPYDNGILLKFETV